MTKTIMFLIVAMLTTVENAHFGWNSFPASDAELICDLLLAILLFKAMAYKELP